MPFATKLLRLVLAIWLVMQCTELPLAQAGPPARRTASPASRYRVQTLHNLVTTSCLPCALACSPACQSCAQCVHDTLAHGPVPGWLAYGGSNAHLPTLRRAGYEAQAQRLLRYLLRQPYVRDSAQYAPYQALETVPQGARPPLAKPWAQSSVLNATLVLTPQRDSLLCVQVGYTTTTEFYTHQADSSYCFSLRKGRVAVVSEWPRPGLVRARPVLQARVLAAAGPWLRAQAHRQLHQSWPLTRLFIARFAFTAQGLQIVCGRVDARGWPLQDRLAVTVPYSLFNKNTFVF